MQQRNKIRLIYIAALIGTLLIVLSGNSIVVKAQTGEFNFDFAENGAQGWEDVPDPSSGITGAYQTITSSGFTSQCVYATNYNTSYKIIRVQIAIDTQLTITGITLHFTNDINNGLHDGSGVLVAGTGVLSWGQETGTNVEKSWTGSVDFDSGESIFIAISGGKYDGNGCGAGSVSLHDVTITYESGTPGDQPVLSALGSCPFMQNVNAMFSDGHSWTFNDGAATPDGQDHGLYLPPGSSATLGLIMSKYKPYSVIIKTSFQDFDEDDDTEVLNFKLGKTFLFFPLLGEETTTFEIAEANYEPDLTQGSLDYYYLTLSNDEEAPEGTKLIVDYICIDDPSSNVGSGAGENSLTTCRVCEYEATGNIINDILQALQWLWCAIGQLWDCTIKQLFVGIWKAIIKIVESIAFARNWLGVFFDNGGNWLGAVVAQGSSFFAGFITNLIQSGFNALATLFNALGLGHVVNTILHFLANIPQALANLVSSLPGAFQFVIDLWNLFTYWIGRLFETVMYAVGTIPIIIQSIFDGFNAAGNSVPVYAPVCNSSNHILFGPCLGLYVLDYTIFDGPIFYVFIVVLGFVSVNTLLWALQYIREGLSK